jgi:flagellar export protein FliJ
MTKFRLATLLKLRERHRDHAAKSVQDALLAIEKIEQSKRELLSENEQMNLLRKNASHGSMDLKKLLDAQRFQMILDTQVEQLNQHLGQLNQELERRKATLLRCQVALKSLDKLREQRDQSIEAVALTKLQERTDEWSSVRFAMNIQSDSMEG